MGDVVVIGGSSGIGEEIARHYADRGRRVYVSSRDATRAAEAAARIGGDTHGLAVDLSVPEGIAAGLAPIEGPVDHLVVTAVLRDTNTVKDFAIEGARALAVLKVVGYPETVHQLLSRMTDESSVVLFGGLAKERPYPGSTTVTSVNGGVEKMINTMALEIAPIRVNAIHPGIVLDSWYWDNNDAVRDAVLARTPTKRPLLTAHVVDAVRFLLENPSMNGVNLNIDGGWLLP
ncbi:MAG: SDR family oxidoreductase [Acidimicrobiia bacterium]|nr:SDR family oxidoreductase [Acidimicrobiia bacterium]MDH4307622.1 SDR family oxidoreductase [Acidimicrobiia bacterium]MDH5294106.1 SDR family oxidoreductase [Acidimicrobiia bacterium]